jgi:hypothetical protein
MRLGKLSGAAIATALSFALSLAAVPGAGAAVRVGNDCFATGVVTNSTVAQILADPANPLPLTVPTAGVVTRWTTKSEYGIPIGQRLKVFRATGIANQFTAVGESAEQTVVDGINTFNTRIPVQGGDRFGLYSPAPSGGAVCTGKPEDGYGYVSGDLPTGSSQTFTVKPGRVAVSALVEPDVDGDGYGDETQDRCLQSAAVQVACPPLSLDAVAKSAGRASVMILVATSTEAPITVSGTVKGTRLTASPKTVTPGAIAGFKLPFPKALKSRLAGLPKSRSLTLKVTAEGRNLAGIAASDRLNVKLKGRG